MLLVIDVGNTNITLGVFNKDELFGTFRMKTKQPRTSDEYGITLQELVERHGIESSKINAVIIASVVPDVMHSLGSAIIKYFGVKPVVVSAGIKTGIRIVTENPRQVGPDRIVDAVGAYTLYGGPTIDFGTVSLGRGRYASGNRDPQTEINSCKRDNYGNAGRPCIRTNRSDGIYYQTNERRIRISECESSGNRRTWQDNCK